MGGRGSSSVGFVSWHRQTHYEQAVSIATRNYDSEHSGGVGVIESIPDWVIEKKLSAGESYAFRNGDGAFVKRETEKAYLIANNSDFGQVSFWMPKSWLSTPEKLREDAIQSAARFIVGSNYNTYLRQTAESAGVKLGNVKRTAGIQEKLTKKGVKFATKDEFKDSKGTKIVEPTFW